MSITHHTTPIIIPALDTTTAAETEVIGTTTVKTGNSVLVQTGTRVKTNDGGEAVYVQAGSAIPQYNMVVLAVDNTVTNATTALLTDGSGTAKEVGWAQTSIASGSYGWVQTSGRPKGKLATDCADRVILFATATAGVLDDATVSAAYVVGVVSKTTISNATAITLMVPNGAHARPWSNPA